MLRRPRLWLQNVLKHYKVGTFATEASRMHFSAPCVYFALSFNAIVKIVMNDLFMQRPQAADAPSLSGEGKE